MKMLKSFLKNLRLIDYLLIFVAVTGIFSFLFFFSREKKAVYVHAISIGEGIKEEVFEPYNLIPPFFWISNSIEEGDIVFTESGSVVGEVFGVENVDYSAQRRYSMVKLKMDTLFDGRTRQYRIGDQPLRTGELISMNIGTTKYRGMIVYVGETSEPPKSSFKQLNIELKVEGVEPWLARTYNENFVVKNTQGKEVFRILESREVFSQETTKTASGNIVARTNPLKKDVFIKAKVRAYCQNDICYYNWTIPLKIGNSFWVESPQSVIKEENTKIIGVELKNDSQEKE